MNWDIYIFLIVCSSIYIITTKKVLLHELKRHTDHGVSSTPSVTRGGVPPPPQPGLMGRVPKVGYPPGRGTPSQVWKGGTQGGVPPCRGTPGRSDGGYPRWGTPQQGYLLARSDGERGTWGGVPPGRGIPSRDTPSRGTPLVRSDGVPEVGYPLARSDRGYPRQGTPTLLVGVPPAGPGWGMPSSWTWPGYTPPEVWTDRHLWKQYLTVVLRTRSVIKHNKVKN